MAPGKCLFSRSVVAVATCALVVLTSAGLVACAAIDREDRFYLADAEPFDPDYLFVLDADPEKSSFDRESFGFAAHRLAPGRGVVFGHRFYSNGSVLAIDDEVYRKVTVWLPSGAPQSPREFDLGNRASVVAMFSRGASAWPEGDCSGYISSGTVRVEPSSRGYWVSVDGELEPRGNREVGKHCRPQHVHVEWKASELSFGDLTPWLGAGAPGAHPYSETYR